MNNGAAFEAEASMVEGNMEAKVASIPATIPPFSASKRLKILQISQWSLKHIILFFDMVEKNEIELGQIIETYEKDCRQFLPGVPIFRGIKDLEDPASLKLVKDVIELNPDSGKRLVPLEGNVYGLHDPASGKHLVRLEGNVYGIDSGKLFRCELDPALRERLKDELEKLRKIDQQTEWLSAIKEARYLLQPATLEPKLVQEVSTVVEDQEVPGIVEEKDVDVSEAKAFMVNENNEAGAVPKVLAENETPIIELPLPISGPVLECNEVMESIQSIYEAVERGELEEFKRLIKLIPVNHWSLSPGEYKGATPLHWAALHGQVEMVSFIQKEMATFMRENAATMGSGKEPIESEADRIRLQIVNARDEHGFTPLHLAVYYTKLDTAISTKGSSQMIEDLFKMGATNCSTTRSSSSVIDADCLSNPLYPIHLAIWFARPLIVEKLLEIWPHDAFVKTKCGDSSLHLAAWCANMDNDGGDVISLLLNYLDHTPNKDAINSLNHDRQSPLHIATLNGNAKCVEALLRCEQIKVNQRNWRGFTPLEIATVKFEQYKPSLSKSRCSERQGDANVYHRMQDKDYVMFGVSKFVGEYDERRTAPVIGLEIITRLFDGLDAEALHKERQVYVDAANAILVGAALIASASFGAWLQPPLGYVPYYSSQFLVTDYGAPPDTYQSYVAIQQHWIIQLFWIFNTLAFFFSLATVIAGADAAVPRQGLILKDAVRSVRSGVKWASWLLSIAILFVIGAFTTIGFAILPPIEKYKINMYITSFIGLLVCGFLLLKLFRKLDNRHLEEKHIKICGKKISFHF